MGAYKSDWVKEKERRRGLDRYKWRRRDEQKATSKQINFLIELGHKQGWEALATLDWVKGKFILEHCHCDVDCFMDLTKTEVSSAIDRLKKGLV